MNSCVEFEWVGEIDGYGFEQFVQSMEFGEVLVVVWQRFCARGGGFCGVSMSWQKWV